MKRALSALATLRLWLEPWWVLALAAFGGAAVVAGVFDDAQFGILKIAVAIGLLAVTALDTRSRLRGEEPERHFGIYEGPVLWVVCTWMLMRQLSLVSPEVTIAGAALIAWLTTCIPRHVWIFAVGAAVTMEFGLTVVERQSVATLFVHGAIYVLASYGLRRFADSEAFRTHLYEARARRDKEADEEARARDFGLLTAQAPMIEELPGISNAGSTVGRATLNFIDESFVLQLEQLRLAMGLTTAVILWRSGKGLSVRGCSSSRDDILKGPFPEGLGVPGSALRELSEVAVAPVFDKFGGLPYYEMPGGVGSLLAIAIPGGSISGERADDPVGVLCIDRLAREAWTEEERTVLRAVAQKIALDVVTGQRLKATDHERSTVRRFCAALGELNGALGLDQVSEASLGAVGAIVKADLGVVSAFDGQCHRVLHASGQSSQSVDGLEFASEEGLVGQAVKVQHTLPSRGEYRGKRPVFGDEHALPNMRSLYIVPLTSPSGVAVGALTVASNREHAFASSEREMLELVAGQVAVKLELARAHEQIRELATTDGLTGLNNHRTFQQSFNSMLARAERRQGSMVMILMDIDHFKRLNDTYGHPFGDEVLRGVAAVLNRVVRKVDLAARYGGEEFAVLLEDSDAAAGMMIAERIRREVESLSFVHADKGSVGVTLSLGVTTFPVDGTDKTQLIARADQALYSAKEHGRNQVCEWAALATKSQQEQAVVTVAAEIGV